MRLAEVLKVPSPGALLAGLSAKEYAQWQNHLSFGTFLERLLDRHFATIEALFYNAHRRKHAPVRRPKDFLLIAQPPPSQQAGDALFGKMKAMVLATGGEIIDNRGRTN